jgi:hypothetical protein
MNLHAYSDGYLNSRVMKSMDFIAECDRVLEHLRLLQVGQPHDIDIIKNSLLIDEQYLHQPELVSKCIENIDHAQILLKRHLQELMVERARRSAIKLPEIACEHDTSRDAESDAQEGEQPS